MALRSIIAIEPSGASLEDALASPADTILLTLADARFPLELLRTAAQLSAAKAREAGKRACVTVNHPRTRLTRADLEALVSPDLAGVVIPHCVEPQDVRDVAVLLREFELLGGIEPGSVAIIPQIDSARGLTRAIEIVQAAPRVSALLFHGKRYATDIGARDEEKGERLSYARGAVVAAARAFDKVPLVATNGIELRVMAQYGFAGAVLPEAGFAILANTTFATTEGQASRAHEEIAAYEAARGGEEWVGRIGSDVIDAHTVRKARQRLE
jgi:citrate lyase subunit beta/citryl-CoA lyase